MKKFVVLIVWVIMLIAHAKAFEVSLLFNNKESVSVELVADDTTLDEWKAKHPLSAVELRTKAISALKTTFNEMEKVNTTCDLGLSTHLENEAEKLGVLKKEEDSPLFHAYLRQENLIDDILYGILKKSHELTDAFKKNAKNYPKRPLNLYTKYTAGFEYEKFYRPVKTWPDDKSHCTLDTYFTMVRGLTWKNNKDLDSQMLRYNYIARLNGTIDLETFNKLEVLRQKNVLDWPVYFKRYADIVNNAKDKLTKKPETTTTNTFTVEYVSRKEKITKRAHLYSTYNSTQIMMMAQIMEKTAKRLDSRRVSLNWQYTDDPSGETEVYIFSPMEQYRAAIKMLRRDMAEVMRSETFRGTGFEYAHLIAAAYESGFIKSEELDYVLRFEDLWNPKTPKWQAYTDFAFNLAGSASFYLPPPWNVIGAIALVLTQAKVNGESEPDPDDNWNVII